MRYLAAFCMLFLVSSVYPQSESSWGPAKWVWDNADGATNPQTNDPRYLRQTFLLNQPVVRAELWVTADNAFTVYINGTKVGLGNDWNVVNKYNVHKHLRPGKNVLAMEAVNQGGVAGAIARLRMQTKDNKIHFIVTDRRTKLSLTKENGWFQINYDDGTWPNAFELGDTGMGPWSIAERTGSSQGFNFSTVDPKVKDRQKAEDQVKNFIVPDGFVVELVAADPLIINPVTMTLDDQGRIYVSESHTYRYGPNGSPIKPYANPVVRLDPDGKGGLKRKLVTEGFADPAMGLAIRNNKLWLSACDFLYTFDLNEDGSASNKKTIVTDKNKAWNPFGMFVLEWGPDGLLYMSVGNHNIALVGADGGKLSGRGSSGIVLRMQPDGSKMERLVHGLRVPYSFEFDPFGQLWLLSNGEGNPNRFVRVIDGVDYHCYTRTNDGRWLSGQHPLAPPCFELHRGADTQLLRYFGEAFPKEYQGNLLVCNWGGHGFPGLNRGIFRFVTDDRNNIVKKEPFVLCGDPYFRPSHIALDHEGNLLIADWYGRDDESDLTGRIWRVRPKTKIAPAKAKDLYDSLVSANHITRQRATETLVREGGKHINRLAEIASGCKEPLGAAHALWALLQMGPEGQSQIAQGTKHPDWRVRRLAINLLRRYASTNADAFAQKLATDTDPAVRVEAALARANAKSIRADLVAALRAGAAKDDHLRYEAGWHLGKHADMDSLTSLLTSEDPDQQAAGLIAVDVACYENFETKKLALAALGKSLERPGKLNLDLALDIVKLNAEGNLAASMAKFVQRKDLSPAQLTKGILLMKGKIGGFNRDLGVSVGKQFVAEIEKGDIRLSTPEDHVIFLEFLEFDGPTPTALKHIAKMIKGGNPAVRPSALALARRFGKASQSLAPDLWKGVLDGKLRLEDRLDFLATVAVTEDKANAENWRNVLASPDPILVTDAVRWWRRFKDLPLSETLVQRSPELLKGHPNLVDDLGAVFQHLGVSGAQKLPVPEKDQRVLGQVTQKAISALSSGEKKQRGLLGKQVFERSSCVKCHIAVTQNTPLAPSLKGVGAQKIDYLIESVLYPSKIIKTGFETEVIVSKKGETISGLIKDEGARVRIFNLDREQTVDKSNIEERYVQRLSIMPEGQQLTLSRREFADLIVYLSTLK